MPEDNAPEKNKEVTPRSGAPYRMPNWDETKETAKEIKKDVVLFVGDEVIEIVTQPARATVSNILDRVRNGFKAFLAPADAGPTCGVVTRTGKACTQTILPCRYHGGS